ncbi:hypothetical protein [Cellulomonas xiejunii]|uniref:hypothetical protein n=1 Tax=Cellulomonas xiejunii TaxID=2968083 RepID=UPI001D0EB832|nr:hypothetical protein [Cellulomonas xiejunii]MCC2315539.1 hypothetical protein [Cellulomonas xiejunii]
MTETHRTCLRRLASTLVTLVVVGALAVSVSGCATTAPRPDLPDGAITLRANIPTSFDGVTAAASNVTEDTAVINVWDGTNPAEAVDLKVGDSGTVLGRTVTLVATRVGNDERPNLPDATAWITLDSSDAPATAASTSERPTLP